MTTSIAPVHARQKFKLAAVFLSWFFLLCPSHAQQGSIILHDPVVSSRPVAERPKQVHRCRPGPWGDLEYYTTFLEAPDALVELVSVPSQQTIWRFMGMTGEEVKTLIRNSGVPENVQSELFDRSVWYVTDEEVRVHPSAVAIPVIPADARRKIYGALRRWEENPFHKTPVVIESGDVRKFFAESGFSESVLTAIERTSYTLGDSLLFSDVPWCLGQLATDAEERRFLRALTRTRTLILRLRVSQKTDARQLAEYWTAGFNHRDTLPILESIFRTRSVQHLDVAHLLPPTPRKHLYTFPSLSAGISGRYPDSFWTSLNFFEVWPKDSFHDADTVVAHARSKYEPVQPPFQFGDVLFLFGEKADQAIHSAVQIADDIVYTKNGEHLFQPWILSTMKDLIARYRIEGELKVEGWRRKKVASIPDPSKANANAIE